MSERGLFVAFILVTMLFVLSFVGWVHGGKDKDVWAFSTGVNLSFMLVAGLMLLKVLS